MPRVLVLFSVVAILLLGGFSVGASTVRAAGPTIVDETLTPPVPVSFGGLSCQDPDFAILITSLTIDRRRILFSDEAGNLIRELRHVAFAGGLTNAVTGTTVPYDGHFTFDLDYVTQTSTRTGVELRVQVPGQGVLALNTGQSTFDSLTPPVDLVSDTGHTLAEFQAALCAILA
ncbi:MAG: hypothetical protein ACJ789_20115 [Thermomicrobiales bacterium]